MTKNRQTTRQTYTRNAGFSLVEVAIVIVIVALLAGGIVTGQTLIRQAELRSVISGMTDLEGAVTTFESQYFGLPGDLTNASSFWPNCDGTPANCNGDGDGLIETAERYRALQQLADADLVSGNYSGAGNPPVLGANIVESRLSPAGFVVEVIVNGAVNDEDSWSTESTGNHVFFGAINGNEVTGPALLTEEAYNIDLKVDDGLPGTGRFQGSVKTSACFSGTTPAATYVLTVTTPVCAVHYRL